MLIKSFVIRKPPLRLPRGVARMGRVVDLKAIKAFTKPLARKLFISVIFSVPKAE